MQPMHNIPARGGINYDESPFLAIWEITQSCDLACKHCRAAAQPSCQEKGEDPAHDEREQEQYVVGESSVGATQQV